MSEYVLASEDVKDEYGRVRLIEGDVYRLREISPDDKRYCVMDELGVKAFYRKRYFNSVKWIKEGD